MYVKYQMIQKGNMDEILKKAQDELNKYAGSKSIRKKIEG